LHNEGSDFINGVTIVGFHFMVETRKKNLIGRSMSLGVALKGISCAWPFLFLFPGSLR
jgi:hypothetical protein